MFWPTFGQKAKLLDHNILVHLEYHLGWYQICLIEEFDVAFESCFQKYKVEFDTTPITYVFSKEVMTSPSFENPNKVKNYRFEDDFLIISLPHKNIF